MKKNCRTIFIGKMLSKHCKPAPPVNIMDIPDLLERIGRMQNVHMYFADKRHWFHQLKVCSFLSERFSLRFKVNDPNKQYASYTCLSMGWTFSPYLSQCTGWSLILRRGSPPGQGGLYSYDIADGLEAPPRYINILDASKKIVGFVTLLYDNIGIFCSSRSIGEAAYNEIKANAAEAHVIFKQSSLVYAGPDEVDISNISPL